MLTSVINHYKWSPEIVGDLFFDAEDYLGLEYWYNEVKRISDDFKSSMPKK
jgi:hypothetical protein